MTENERLNALRQVTGSVSIDGGIATLPDGSTVDLRAAAPAAAAVRTTADETLDLLYKVAEDVSHLIACNCSHDLSEAEPWTCHGTCTHGMAVRALAAQLSAGAAKAG